MGINPLLSVGLNLLSPGTGSAKWPMNVDWYVLRVDTQPAESPEKTYARVQNDLRQVLLAILAEKLPGTPVIEKVDGSYYTYEFSGQACENFLRSLSRDSLRNLYSGKHGCRVNLSGLTLMGPANAELFGKDGLVFRFRTTVPAQYMFQSLGTSLYYYLPRFKGHYSAAVLTGGKVYRFVQPVEDGQDFSIAIKGSRYQNIWERSF